MQRKMRHSKFRNTGILFELLARQITADILAGRDDSDAKHLLHKYFKENTELGKEWQLYNFLLTEKIGDENKADRVISVVITQRAKLNNRRLSEEKYSLIKEVKDLYPINDFLRAKIHNYRILASIYKLFEDCASTSTKFDVNEMCQAKECIIEHIINKPRIPKSSEEEILMEYERQPQDVRLLSYKFMVEGLNKKYKDLDDNQKEILREYITNISNTNSLGAFISTKIEVIKKELSEVICQIKDDEVIKIKIDEVIKQLDKIHPGKTVKDNQVTALLLGFELLKEIKKSIS